MDNSFCPTRWTAININPTTGFSSACCHHPYRKMQISPTLTLNDAKEFESRELMLAGKRPIECKKCWDIEDVGGVSPRMRRANFSINDEIKKMYVEDKLKLEQKPNWVELRMGRTCQFSCLYCSNNFSTAWDRDFQLHGAFPTKRQHQFTFRKDAELSDQEQMSICENVIANLPTISFLTLSGGEPLLNNLTFTLLNSLKAKRECEINVSIYTNLCAPELYWRKFISILKEIISNPQVKLNLCISNESWGPQAEFIRRGLDIELFKVRVLEILNETNISIYFAMAHNVLSLQNFMPFFQWIIALKLDFQKGDRLLRVACNMVSDPDYLSPTIWAQTNFARRLVDDITKSIKNNSDVFTTGERDAINSLILVLQNSKGSNTLDELSRFLDACDQRYRTNWKIIFPDLFELLSIKNIESARDA